MSAPERRLSAPERPVSAPERHLSAPGRPLLGGPREVLSAPADSFSADDVQRHAALASARLLTLEERLSANPPPPGAQKETQLTAGDDLSIAQEVGRIGLQRLLLVQAISNQTRL